MTTYYKFLTANHTGTYSTFDYSAYLPKGSKPGAWLPKVVEIELCESGYHACLKKDLMKWADDHLYIVELRGKKINDTNKVVAQEMRFVRQIKGWNEKNLRLAAADVVEKISLPIWKKYYPDDHTLEDVIDTVRRYANGEATYAELSAAWRAAWSAAQRAAERAAWRAAQSAAWSAAQRAAESAAQSAAESAAWRIIYKRCGL